MTDIRFLHVADVHLDSPLAKLEKLDEQAAQMLRLASRKSLENIVQAALEHEVSLVVIAGDLFDRQVKDVSSGLWVERQFRKLSRAGIPIVLIRGNHDALNKSNTVIQWSEGIYELGSDAPETVCFEDAGIAVHGQSFGARSETQDLAANYPSPVPGLFNIGLLHTSLNGKPGHDPYAPTTTATLEAKGYDYWALGHIHARSEQSESDKCYIGYSGIPQGRHVGETGAKGCHLVHLRDGELQRLEFLEMDSLRWQILELDLSAVERLSDIEPCVEAAAAQELERLGERSLAVRLILRGNTALHADLTTLGAIEQLSEGIAAGLSELGPIWLESIKLRTRPQASLNIESLELPRMYMKQVTEELRTNEVAQAELHEVLQDLLRKAQSELAEYEVAVDKPESSEAELQNWIEQAEDLLLARLGKAVQS